jgi:hypothetical protein
MKLFAAALCLELAFVTAAIPQTTPSKGTVERIKVHGKSLEGNLEGDSPDKGCLRLPATGVRECTRTTTTAGSAESRISSTFPRWWTSLWRMYVASRGLAGHSMGGYGTMRIGMKYPDVFSSIYALSPCCMIPNLSGQQGRGGPSRNEPPRATQQSEESAVLRSADERWAGTERHLWRSGRPMHRWLWWTNISGDKDTAIAGDGQDPGRDAEHIHLKFD